MLYDEIEIRQRVPEWSKPVNTRLPHRFDSSRHRLLEQKRREQTERGARTAAKIFRRTAILAANLAIRIRRHAGATQKIAATLLRMVGERSQPGIAQHIQHVAENQHGIHRNRR